MNKHYIHDPKNKQGYWVSDAQVPCQKCTADLALKRELVEALKYIVAGLRRINAFIPSDIENLITRAEKTL